MGFITAITDVQDANGNSIIVARPDGTRSPMVLKVGSGLSTSYTQSGDQGIVALAAGGTGSFSDITLPPEARPSAPSSGWKIFVDSADGQLKAEDASGNVITMSNERYVTNTKTLNANNTTAHVSLFQFTGTIFIPKLYGQVTTTLGANHTGAQFTQYDSSSRSNITDSVSAPTASGFVAGASLLAAAGNGPLVFENGNAGAGQGGTDIFKQYWLIAKHGANNFIEYTYITTDTPTSGAIQFFMTWVPLSADATVTVV